MTECQRQTVQLLEETAGKRLSLSSPRSRVSRPRSCSTQDRAVRTASLAPCVYSLAPRTLGGTAFQRTSLSTKERKLDIHMKKKMTC